MTAPPCPSLPLFLSLSFSFKNFQPVVLPPVWPRAFLPSRIHHRWGYVSALPGTRRPKPAPVVEAKLPARWGPRAPPDSALRASAAGLRCKVCASADGPGGDSETPPTSTQLPVAGVPVELPPARSWRPPSPSFQAVPGEGVSFSQSTLSSLTLLSGPSLCTHVPTHME